MYTKTPCILLKYSILLCLGFCLTGAQTIASEADKSTFIEGGVKGAATIKPSLKVIQPEETKSGPNSKRLPVYDNSGGGDFSDYYAERRRRKEAKRQRRRLKKQRKKRRNRRRGKFRPISSYEYSSKRVRASTPRRKYRQRSSQNTDVLWMRSLTRGILKNSSYSYVPILSATGNGKKRSRKAQKRNRKRKHAKRRQMRGYGIYSSRDKEFISPGYSVSYSTNQVKESTLGGNWYESDKDDSPIALIAKAGRLGDPIFVQPVVADQLGVGSEFRLDPKTEGLVWSDWYKATARAIYNNWAQTEVGPGMARVQVLVTKDRKVKSRILSFQPAPLVTRNGIEEKAFCKAALRAVSKVSSFDIPKFPQNRNRVVFEIEMKRMVSGPSGIEIALEQAPNVDEIMQMVDTLSPYEQKRLLGEYLK